MEIKVKEQQKDHIKHEFYSTLISDFGQVEHTDKIENWHDYSWEEFKDELKNQNIDPPREWYEYFVLMKGLYIRRE